MLLVSSFTLKNGPQAMPQSASGLDQVPSTFGVCVGASFAPYVDSAYVPLCGLPPLSAVRGRMKLAPPLTYQVTFFAVPSQFL